MAGAGTFDFLLKQQAAASNDANKQKQIALAAQAATEPQPNMVSQLLGLGQPQLKTDVKTVLPQAISDEELTEAQNSVNKIPELQALKQNLSNTLETMSPAMLGPNNLDLSPLAGLADYFSQKPGTALKAYEDIKPNSPTDTSKLILALNNMIQKEKEGLSDTERDYLKQALSGARTFEKSDQTGKPSQAANQVNREFRDGVNKSVSNAYDKIQQMDTISEAIDSGDYQKLKGALAQYARAVSGERGVLTDNDILRVIPKNFHQNAMDFISYFSETPSAQFDPAYVKSLKEMVEASKGIMRKRNEEKIEGLKDRYSQLPGFDPHNVPFADKSKDQLKQIAPEQSTQDVSKQNWLDAVNHLNTLIDKK